METEQLFKQKRNYLGSQIFNTSVVRTDEYVLMAGVITDAGCSIEDAALQIECIDDCLAMQRMVYTVGQTKRQIYTETGRVRKGGIYMDFLNRRFDQLVEDMKAEKERKHQ